MRRLVPFLLLTACGTLTVPGGDKAVTGTAFTDSGAPVTLVTGTGVGTGSGTGGTSGCAPVDEYDNEALHPAGEGDSCDRAVILPGTLPDTEATAEFRGNAHRDADTDWWVVHATDLGGDEQRGYEDFHLEIAITEGAELYHMLVIKGACTGTETCAPGELYDSFSWFSEDTSPDPVDGSFPSDLRACGAPPLDDCPDYTDTYLVKVVPISGLEECTPYTVELRNGVW